MASSQCIAALQACNGNEVRMESTFDKWIKANLNHSYSWSDYEMKSVFGCFQNDCVRENALKNFVKQNLKSGGRSNGSDVVAICSLTNNETMKKKYVEILAPLLDSQYNHPSPGMEQILSAFDNNAVKMSVREIEFGNRETDNDSNSSEDEEGEENEYNGPPPPGMEGMMPGMFAPTSNGMSGMPGMGGMPGMPVMGGMPGMPGIPGMGGMKGMPGMFPPTGNGDETNMPMMGMGMGNKQGGGFPF